MSNLVKIRLKQLGIETDHELRALIDALIEERTNEPCDTAVASLSDGEFMDIVILARIRLRGNLKPRKQEAPIVMYT